MISIYTSASCRKTWEKKTITCFIARFFQSLSFTGAMEDDFTLYSCAFWTFLLLLVRRCAFHVRRSSHAGVTTVALSHTSTHQSITSLKLSSSPPRARRSAEAPTAAFCSPNIKGVTLLLSICKCFWTRLIEMVMAASVVCDAAVGQTCADLRNAFRSSASFDFCASQRDEVGAAGKNIYGGTNHGSRFRGNCIRKKERSIPALTQQFVNVYMSYLLKPDFSCIYTYTSWWGRSRTL